MTEFYRICMHNLPEESICLPDYINFRLAVAKWSIFLESSKMQYPAIEVSLFRRPGVTHSFEA